MSTHHVATNWISKLTFRISGKDIREDKVREAIKLSQEKYCGVTAMLRAHCPVTWELVIN